MDARSKASFVNAVADGQLLVCPNCQFGNPLDSRFCIKCGHQLKENKPVDTAPAFATAEETPAVSQSPAFSSVEEKSSKVKAPAFVSVPVAQEEEEPKSAFAQGLPEWSLEPPMMVVRRK